MTLFSYIVAHDTGFAPNPFFGYCTLACCKPVIRRTAKLGDWIVGLTPKANGNKIVYFMKVDEAPLAFDKYWTHPRFRKKKPELNAGFKHKNGDNIYEPQPGGEPRQLPSAHSEPRFGNGQNVRMKKRDLEGKQVLVSRTFAYFGSNALELPPELQDLKVGIGHRSRSLDNVQKKFLHFVSTQRKSGVLGPPGDWTNDDGSWRSSACGSR